MEEKKTCPKHPSFWADTCRVCESQSTPQERLTVRQLLEQVKTQEHRSAMVTCLVVKSLLEKHDFSGLIQELEVGEKTTWVDKLGGEEATAARVMVAGLKFLEEWTTIVKEGEVG